MKVEVLADIEYLQKIFGGNLKTRESGIPLSRVLLYFENPQIVWGFRNRLMPMWY